MENNNMDLTEKWNKSNQRMPKDKSTSNYAIQKEALFPKKSIVLDLGGASGEDALYFAKNGHKVIVADISDYALATAKEKAAQLHLGLQTIKVDLEKQSIPLNPNSIDIIYSRLVLHYFDYSRTVLILNNLYQILKPSGKAYISVKSPEDQKEMHHLLKTATVIGQGVYNGQGQQKSRFDKSQWQNILKDANIRNLEINNYTESLGNRKDIIKSGNTQFNLYEIVFWK